MSINRIASESIYAVRRGRQGGKFRPHALNQGAPREVVSESKHRLLNGTIRKCLHYIEYDAPVRTKIGKAKIDLFQEGTYSEAVLMSKEYELAEQAHATHRRIERDIAEGVARTMAANEAAQQVARVTNVPHKKGEPFKMNGLQHEVVGTPRPDWKAASEKKLKALKPKRKKTVRGFR